MDPLHVGNIYRGKERIHRDTMQDRQDLILYLARIHARASTAARKGARGLIEIPMRLTSLRDWVYDYRPALDYFFDVKQLGYNVSDDANAISILTPKDLGLHTLVQTDSFKLSYEPGERPEGVMSKVYIHGSREIMKRLEDERRFDLIDPVVWLLNQGGEVNFIFQPAGKLQQRDTSVWPVAAVETWPSWLREQLFGPGIDIDSAYTQYLMHNLREAYADRPHLVDLLFPDLVQLIADKQAWRQDLCRTLGLEWNEGNVSIIKKVCMSLANGSRISPAIITGCRAYSITAEIMVQATEDVSIENLERIGARLQKIAKQYSNAKRIICSSDLKLNPTRRNQKRVFSSYFEWEREARYLIWNAVDQHGIMVHDGIDGIPEEYLKDLPERIGKIGLKVTL